MTNDEAYSNAAFIPDGAAYHDKWVIAAEDFRSGAIAELDLAYDTSARGRFDLFHPGRLARGLFVFVHGGYWLESDKSDWSHLAAGALARGWAVAIPSYDLCPKVRIGEITRQVMAAIGAAAVRVPGPIRLAGHSAGGHLVARMACTDLAPEWRDRVARIVPISPLSDLAPLMETSMNADLRIDAAEAIAESPLHHGCAAHDVTVWVGGAERPAFLDQARWLAERWGCGHVVAPEWHHFDVFEGLTEAQSPLCRAIFGDGD